MEKPILILFFLIVLLFSLAGTALAQMCIDDPDNLVDNGAFEDGNTGFTSSYTFTTGAIVFAGTYGIDDDPRDRHDRWASFGDHTCGTGNMMIANGSPATGADAFVWQTPIGSEITITSGTDYFFEAFIGNAHPVNGAILTFEVFNSTSGNWDTLGDADLSGVPVAEWQPISFIWNSGSNTSTRLRLLNAQPANGGNDFVIDDIYFAATTSIPPSISLEKNGTGPDPLIEGETIEYQFLVTNTGEVPLTNVTVTDPLTDPTPITCPDTDLDPGDFTTCTVDYVITAADEAEGFITNTATVSAEGPNGTTAEDEDTALVPSSQVPGISLEKSGSGPDPLIAGSIVTYSFLVTNSGEVTLSNIVVTDPLPGLSGIVCPDTELDPGDFTTCTATYMVTQDDADSGEILNTASVTGQPPGNQSPPTAEDSFVLMTAQLPAITLEKSVGEDPSDAIPLVAGETITYTFIATNTGNVTLTNVMISEVAFSGAGTMTVLDCTPVQGSSLNPMDTMTCTAEYTVQSADVDARQLTNTAVASGLDPNNNPVTDEDEAEVAPIFIDLTGGPCWRMLSSPVEGLTYVDMLEEIWTV